MLSKKGALRDLLELQSRLNSIISEVLEPSAKSGNENISLWTPPADVSEDDENFYIEIEVPGVDIEDIDITCEGNSVKIKGERKFSREIASDNVHRMERFFGNFFREFDFVPQIDRDKIEAKLENGVLELVMPKKNQKKKISIR